MYKKLYISGEIFPFSNILLVMVVRRNSSLFFLPFPRFHFLLSFAFFLSQTDENIKRKGESFLDRREKVSLKRYGGKI